MSYIYFIGWILYIETVSLQNYLSFLHVCPTHAYYFHVSFILLISLLLMWLWMMRRNNLWCDSWILVINTLKPWQQAHQYVKWDGPSGRHESMIQTLPHWFATDTVPTSSIFCKCLCIFCYWRRGEGCSPKGGPRGLPLQVRNDRGDSWISALSLPLCIPHPLLPPPFVHWQVWGYSPMNLNDPAHIGNHYPPATNVHCECESSVVDVTDHLKQTCTCEC